MNRARMSMITALAAATIVLAGCASASPSAAPSSKSPAPTTPPASATPSPTPEVESHLVVAVDGISYVDSAGTQTAAYADGDALLALLEQATGELPAPEPIEPMPGYPMNLERYSWDGLWVSADVDGQRPVGIGVQGAEVDGIPITTAEGLGVGSTRQEMLDAQAWALVSQEDAATAANLGLGGQEVPGTESLSRPGSVGIEYLLFSLEGDVVTQINAPANDFSDL